MIKSYFAEVSVEDLSDEQREIGAVGNTKSENKLFPIHYLQIYLIIN